MHHTQEYYAALREVQGGSYQPQRDASGWVAFCVEAHIAQARQRLAQIERAAARWGYLEELVEERDWPERLVIALEQSLGGWHRARQVRRRGRGLTGDGERRLPPPARRGPRRDSTAAGGTSATLRATAFGARSKR